MVPPHAPVDVATWRDAVCRSFVRLDIDPRSPTDRFVGRIAGAERGRVRADRVEVRGAPHVIRRSPAAVTTDGGQLLVSVQLRGTCVVTQHHREAVLNPFDLTIYDTAEPYELFFPEGNHTQVVLQIPRVLLPVRGLGDRTAVPISGTGGTGEAVSSLLAALPSALAKTSPTEGERLVRASLDMLTLGFQLDPGPPPDQHYLLTRAQRFIAAHADDPELTPSAIAAAVHVSVGHLHRLFRVSGTTVRGSLLDLRVARCAQDLQDHRLRYQTIAEIALARGFKDAAHFTRAFSERYRMPPSAWRRDGQQPSGAQRAQAPSVQRVGPTP